VNYQRNRRSPTEAGHRNHAATLHLVIGGSAALLIGATQRTDGYLTSPAVTYATTGYAISSNRIDLAGTRFERGWPRTLLGTVRVRATFIDAGTAVFIGIAPAGSAHAYLSGVARSVTGSINGRHLMLVQHPGGRPATIPDEQTVWTAHASGTETQTVMWPVTSGSWTLVVMSADGSSGVNVRTDFGATVPNLRSIAVGVLIGGVRLLACAALLMAMAIRAVSRRTRRPTA
jgi:hypothetical protein